MAPTYPLNIAPSATATYFLIEIWASRKAAGRGGANIE